MLRVQRGAGTGYTRSDREVALAALDDLLSGPGWTRLVAEAEAEFWGELHPQQTALADNETIALISSSLRAPRRCVSTR
jgi:hypothetical protein